jgi:hypothetical protein
MAWYRSFRAPTSQRSIVLSPCVYASQGSTRVEQARTTVPGPSQYRASWSCLFDRHTWNPSLCEFRRERKSVRNCLLVFLMCDRLSCRWYHQQAGLLWGSGASSTFPFVFRLGWSCQGASNLWIFTIRGKVNCRAVSLGYVLPIIRIKTMILLFWLDVGHGRGPPESTLLEKDSI